MTDLTLWLDQAVGHHVQGDLSRMEAEAVTAKIKAFAGVAWVLLNEAHQRKAHKAMGYPTWGDYVEAEFDISKSRSYQLISQAKVVLEISESVSTMVDISEREARDLLPVLDEAKAAAVEAKAEAPDPDDAEDVERRIRDALGGVRQAQHQKHTDEMAANATARQTTTTTETTTVEFDPEMGEILGGDDATAESPAPPSPPSRPTSEHPQLDGPKQGGPEGYRASATKARSTVRSHLLTLDATHVVVTADEPDHWRQFSDDVRSWLDTLDAALAGPHLKAVN